MDTLEADVKAVIRDIPDFPKPGILFKDITPVLADHGLMKRIIGGLADRYSGQGVDVVVGMESRGFLFGVPLALHLDAAFVPARKPGKLPHTTVDVTYTLEYGSNTLEMHTDAIAPGQRVLIVDDLLATGGTASATGQLVQKLGGVIVEYAFLIDLTFLNGAEVLQPHSAYSVVRY